MLKTAKSNANKKSSDLNKKLLEVQAELQLCNQRLQTSKLTVQVNFVFHIPYKECFSALCRASVTRGCCCVWSSWMLIG